MTALIVALAVIIPTAAVVIIFRQWFAYRATRSVHAAEHLDAYRQLADQYALLSEATQSELTDLRRQLTEVVTLLRSVD